MSKAYKGYELYKMIAERKIESGTNFIDENGQKWTFDGKQMIWEEHDYNDFEFSITTFELIEDEVKIIEELDKDRIENSSYSYEHHFIEKINEVIQVVNKHTEEMKNVRGVKK